MKYLSLNDITAYKASFELSNYVWEKVTEWNTFTKSTVGRQFVRSIDSISANLAEGFGRFHKKDRIKFYFNARASTFEALGWLQKAKVRRLISESVYKYIFEELKKLPKEINSLIKFTNEKLTI